ncbi:MAG: hypothetical protein AB7G93_02920 [Bdellovibrionales bacterium]
MMDLNFLALADATTLEMEKAKRALEAAKAAFETAKQNYEDMLAKSDEVGIPKGKLKKLTEDRIQMLFESGLVGSGFNEQRSPPKATAPRKSAKPKKGKTEPEANDEANGTESVTEDVPPQESDGLSNS